MTPAIQRLKKSKTPFTIHQYEHDPLSSSYGEEAADKLEVSPERIYKTLIVRLNDGSFAVAILPVLHQLDLKQFAKAAGVKKAAMADKKDAERATGYILGGISPIGQKKRLKTVIDKSAQSNDTIFVSAGRRGLDIELKSEDLRAIIKGRFFQISRKS